MRERVAQLENGCEVSVAVAVLQKGVQLVKAVWVLAQEVFEVMNRRPLVFEAGDQVLAAFWRLQGRGVHAAGSGWAEGAGEPSDGQGRVETTMLSS